MNTKFKYLMTVAVVAVMLVSCGRLDPLNGDDALTKDTSAVSSAATEETEATEAEETSANFPEDDVFGENEIIGEQSLENTAWLSDKGLLLTFYEGCINFSYFTFPYKTVDNTISFEFNAQILNEQTSNAAHRCRDLYNQYYNGVPNAFKAASDGYRYKIDGDTLTIKGLCVENENISFKKYDGINEGFYGVWITDFGSDLGLDYKLFGCAIQTEDGLRYSGDKPDPFHLKNDATVSFTGFNDYSYILNGDSLSIIWIPAGECNNDDDITTNYI